MPNPMIWYSRADTNPVIFYSRDAQRLPILKLQFEGANFQNNTIDSSHSAHTVTAQGDVWLDDTQSVQGNSCSFFNEDGGTGQGGGRNFWAIDASSDFDSVFMNGNWEMYTYAQFKENNDGFAHLFIWFQNAFSGVAFTYVNVGGNYGRLRFSYNQGITSTTLESTEQWYPLFTDQVAFPDVPTFYKLAVTKNGNDFNFFVDDEQLGDTVSSSNPIPGMENTFLGIGGSSNSGAGTPNQAFQGWMDEVTIITESALPLLVYSA